MPMRHAQRKHIIHSLSTLLYQLHTVSFLLSPRIWAYLCRVLVQFHFTRPRDIDSQRSLRFWIFCILVTNSPSLYNHIVKSTAAGRSLILDFVGVDRVPSNAFLLCLDFVIILLQIILTTIAFETSLARDMPPDTPDPLRPEPIPTTTISPDPFGDIDSTPVDKMLHEDGTEYIIDLRIRTLLQRLRHPPTPPPPQPRPADELLPLPNTTFQLSQSIRMLARATARGRERAAPQRAQPARNGTPRSGSSRNSDRPRGERESEAPRRVPGGMASDDEV